MAQRSMIRLAMKNLYRLLWGLALTCFLQYPLLAADAGEGKQLVTDFWRATTQEVQQEIQEQLLDAAPDVETLYRWLKDGPAYSAEVGRGQQEDVRVAEDGTPFPYVYLIPNDYDPATSYPLEFMLHGGVSRPQWEPGGAWWSRGYDSLKQADRIMVVPASWDDAFWWHQNQAESIPAILKTLKRSFNVDDNRVTLTGVSDGGTGVYFFAFKQPTQWAAFLAYIGHPSVLRNAQSGVGYRLYFENLLTRPLYLVNGENDRLYPVSSVQPFINILKEAGISHVFRAIENGGHNTNWLPDERPMIEQFKLDNPRDPLPETVTWVADRTDRYNRNLWIRIDELTGDSRPGMLQVNREGNQITVAAEAISAFTLLLNPEELDFDRPITVIVNGTRQYEEIVTQNMSTLLDWARRDLDRSLLFTAELNLKIPD